MGCGATSGMTSLTGLEAGISSASDEDLKGALAGLSESTRKKLAESLAHLEKKSAAAEAPAQEGARAADGAEATADAEAAASAQKITDTPDAEETKKATEVQSTQAAPSESQEKEAKLEPVSVSGQLEKAESVDSFDYEIEDLKKQIQEIKLVMVRTAQSITPDDDNPSSQPQRMANVNCLMAMAEMLQAELDEKEQAKKDKKTQK
eukprot:TRINITY_DN103383_c0_g1_i1.p1 TRINITY_DN103383_c0_g1~~TRINITY_DN103383_c0_g1_i1.p1  ORF type:complete len:206 (+),score=57.69 TRINITY_DN103383_c0_g1_i1:125-742(+)